MGPSAVGPRAKRNLAAGLQVLTSAMLEALQALEAELFADLSRVTELEEGYTLWFPRTEGQLSRIARFVELEGQCCALSGLRDPIGVW